MKKGRLFFVVFILISLFFPSVAYANVIISPSMVGSLLHLFIGNALVGILEGCLLFWLARTPKVASILLMIFANYLSSWLGFFILGELGFQISRTIENVQFWFWMFVLIAFLLTVLIEFPLVLLILRKKEHKLRKSIWITLVINAVSYVLICGWYLKYSEVSAITDLSVVPASEMQLPDGYVLYFVSLDDKSVLRSDLTGKNAEKVKTIETQGEPGWLFARPSKESTDPSYDLFLYVRCYDLEDPWHAADDKEELILKSFSPSCVVLHEPSIEGDSAEPSDGSHPKDIPQPNTSSEWEYTPIGHSWMSAHGIYCKNRRDGSEFRLSVDAPFFSWAIRHETYFEGDFIIFQLNGDQICILHPPSKKIAFITRGRSPFVAKTKEAEEK